MSSKADVRKYMKFCKHMREAIIDEQKAVPDYEKLLREYKALPMEKGHWFKDSVEGIISDEKRHKKELIPYFNNICPRMAFHRKGIA